jgi:hypothetical protein
LLQERDRFGERCPAIRVLVLEGRRATAGGDVAVLTPVEHRHARLAAAAELDPVGMTVLLLVPPIGWYPCASESPNER